MSSGCSLEVVLRYELTPNHIGTESSPIEEVGTDWNLLALHRSTRGVRRLRELRTEFLLVLLPCYLEVLCLLFLALGFFFWPIFLL